MISDESARTLRNEAEGVLARAEELRRRASMLSWDEIEELWKDAVQVLGDTHRIVGPVINLHPADPTKEISISPSAALEALDIATRAQTIVTQVFQTCRNAALATADGSSKTS